MAEKITHEQYVQWLAENRPEITVLEPYKGNRTPIAHRCEIHEHEWLARPYNIKSGKGCPKCRSEKVGDAKRGHTTESYSEWLAENRPGVQLVGEYKNNRTPTAHICSGGHDWMARPSEVKKGKGCRICSGYAKQSPEQYVQWLADNRPDIQCTGDYVNTQVPVEHQCSDGHVWTTAPCAIKAGTGCPHCCGNIPRDYDEWLSENCPDIRALEPYVSGHESIMHEHECGHQWSARPTNIKSGKGCPKCRACSDFNAVYSWIVTEAPEHVVMPLPGYHLVKSGVTSQKRGDERPLQTMRNNEMQGEIIGLCDTSEGDAPYFEQVLQSLGVQPVFPDDQPKVDGYTEFRIVSDAELEEIRSLLGAQEGALALAA